MQGMRELLRGSLHRSLCELRTEDRLAAAWQVACGSALASRGTIERLDETATLHVRVTAPEWMQTFISMRFALANDLSRISGVSVSGIHFEVKPQTPARPATSSGARPWRRNE